MGGSPMPGSRAVPGRLQHKAWFEVVGNSRGRILPDLTRCGQRWAKAGRPVLRPGQELTGRRQLGKPLVDNLGWRSGKLPGSTGYSSNESEADFASRG